jgi:hypothetical protein
MGFRVEKTLGDYLQQYAPLIFLLIVLYLILT